MLRIVMPDELQVMQITKSDKRYQRLMEIRAPKPEKKKSAFLRLAEAFAPVLFWTVFFVFGCGMIAGFMP